MNGETDQEKALRLAKEEGKREATVDIRLDSHDDAIAETRKQVQLNTNAIIDLNTNNTKAIGEVRHDIADVKKELTDPKGALPRLAVQVDELRGKPIAESRAWKRGMWQGVAVGFAIIVGTAISYVAIGVGHL